MASYNSKYIPAVNALPEQLKEYKSTVTPEEWNELFNVLAEQANQTSAQLRIIHEFLAGPIPTEGIDVELQDDASSILDMFNTWYSSIEDIRNIKDGDLIVPKAASLDDGEHITTAEEARDHIDSEVNPHSVTKAQVGLGNADNTSDANKPVSNATQSSLDNLAGAGRVTETIKGNANDLDAHEALTNNPHGVTKAQVGLGNADNTSDVNKPVSTAQQAAFDLKVSRTFTILGIDFQDDIVLEEFKDAMGIATPLLRGLMSTEDKSRLDALHALLGVNADADAVVNTINEVLAIFNQYPEGAELVTALESKVDKVSGYGLSKNDLTDVLLSKLNGIEIGATADQTASEIKTLYQGELKAFTDALYDKLATIEMNAKDDQTASEIKALYETQVNAFTDALYVKLGTIETNAKDDQTGPEIKVLYEALANTNAFTDAEKADLAEVLGWTNQDVKTTASPEFVDIEITGKGSVKDSLNNLDDCKIYHIVSQSGADLFRTASNTDLVVGRTERIDVSNITNGLTSNITYSIDGGTTKKPVYNNGEPVILSNIEGRGNYMQLIYNGTQWVVGVGSGDFELLAGDSWSPGETITINKGRNDVQDVRLDAVELALSTEGVNTFVKVDKLAEFVATQNVLTKVSFDSILADTNNTAVMEVDVNGDIQLKIAPNNGATITGNFQATSNETGFFSTMEVTFYLFDKDTVKTPGNELDSVILNGQGSGVVVDRSKSVTLSANELNTQGIPLTLEVWYYTEEDVDINKAELSILSLTGNLPAPTEADEIVFDPSGGVLSSVHVQGAIDELEALVVNTDTSAEVDSKIAAIINAAPGTLDTLNELAAALGDDPNFAATVSAELGEHTDAIALNTAKVGITTNQANAIVANTAKVTYDDQAAVAANTAKVGITTNQANAIVANTAKVGITTNQANAIVANTAKVTNVTTNLSLANRGTETLDIESSDGTDVTVPKATGLLTGLMSAADKSKLDGIEAGASGDLANTDALNEGVTNLYHTESRVTNNPAVVLNTAKVSDINHNTITNISVQEAAGNVAIKSSDGSDDTIAIATGSLAGVMSPAMVNKLAGIEAGADVNPTNTDDLAEGSTNLYFTNARADARVALVIDSSPAALNTLNELAAALGDDPNYAATMATALGLKVDKVAGKALSQNDFTDALLAKLNGIAAGANNYSHPSHPGDDINVDTGALSGAVVISDLDFNVTTDTQGHVTDANGVVNTRTLTLANLGYTGASNANYYVHPTHPGDDINVDTGALSGAVVVSDIDFNVTTDAYGHVTDANGVVNTRTLTLANLGYTGASNANYYVLTKAAVDAVAPKAGSVTVVTTCPTSNNTDGYKFYKGAACATHYTGYIYLETS